MLTAKAFPRERPTRIPERSRGNVCGRVERSSEREHDLAGDVPMLGVEDVSEAVRAALADVAVEHAPVSEVAAGSSRRGRSPMGSDMTDAARSCQA